MRSDSLCSAATACSHKPAEVLAATSAVGWPRATSIAKLGPDSTPTSSAGQTAAAISWPSQPVPSSKPLHSHSTPGASVGSARSTSPRPAIGVATMISPPRAWATAASKSAVTCRAGGSAISGR